MAVPFGRTGPMRPEQLSRIFRIYTYESEPTARGREKQLGPMLKGEARCILATAKPNEAERYKQLAVTVTHAIIQRGGPRARENDVFVLVKNGVESRFFRVQAVHNKGELDIDTVFYCQERSDLPSISESTPQ